MLFSVRFLGLWIYMYIYFECGKFRRSRAIVYLVCLVPYCHDAFVGVSRVRDFFSWVFVGLKVFRVGVSFVRSFSWWIFCGSESFSHGYFVGLIFFLEVDFVIQRFFWATETKAEMQKYISNHILFSKTISKTIKKILSASSTKSLTVLRSFHLQ